MVAPSWLNMSPWRAMATPFMPIFMVSQARQSGPVYSFGPGWVSQGKERADLHLRWHRKTRVMNVAESSIPIRFFIYNSWQTQFNPHHCRFPMCFFVLYSFFHWFSRMSIIPPPWDGSIPDPEVSISKNMFSKCLTIYTRSPIVFLRFSEDDCESAILNSEVTFPHPSPFIYHTIATPPLRCGGIDIFALSLKEVTSDSLPNNIKRSIPHVRGPWNASFCNCFGIE